MVLSEQTVNHIKTVGDVAAGAGTVAVIVGWLPSMAAAFTVIYTAIRIWETATARRILKAICERCAAWWDR